MKKKALNFLWLGLDLPAKAHPNEDKGYINNPLPSEYIRNMQEAAKHNQDADTILWVDSKRLTPLQHSWLKATVAPVEMKDLRSIPEYDNEALYNEGDTNQNWRTSFGQKSPIWRQVDAAKVLTVLQGNYEQSFFADMDFAHIDYSSPEVQDRMNDYGFLIGGYRPSMENEEHKIIENQFFGTSKRSKNLFKDIYKKSLKEAYDGKNGWKIFKDRFKGIIEETRADHISVVYDIRPKGSPSFQPGSKNKFGSKDTPNKVTTSMTEEPKYISLLYPNKVSPR